MLISLLSLWLTLASAAPQVRLGGTTLVGSDFTASGVEFFGAIPFAKPPVGNLRFQPPVLTTALSGPTFDASNFGAGCLQTVVPLFNYRALPPNLVSEDCLTLNVFRPAGLHANASLPVLFWIYGGAFVMGASSLYNGTAIVSHSVARGSPVIFASVNYRVGPLGFPQGAEAGAKGALNLGLKDQLAGLRWIQANIGLFGGDKTKVEFPTRSRPISNLPLGLCSCLVTISGESAGATSVQTHLISSTTNGLVRAAIIESTAITPIFGPEHNEASWQAFVSAVPECAPLATTSDTFDCLRAANSSILLQAFATAEILGASFSPVIDGPGGIIPQIPSTLTPQTHFPVLIGSNLDEGTLFTLQATNSTEEIFESIFAASSPSARSQGALTAAVNEILALYPNDPSIGSPFGTGTNTFGLNPQYKRAAAINPDAVIDPSLTPIPPVPGSLGIAHSSEIDYVFGVLANPTPTAISLSGIMQDYWISFVNSLDPNDGLGNKRLQWAQYTPSNQVSMQLNGHNTTMIPDDFRAEQIAFLNADPLVFHR
ncbi:triacylglycerol lipase 3 [Infundibulicybe gibba]|nr:triacylglycerol lipase 3 [Infundibulicybe gibba]